MDPNINRWFYMNPPPPNIELIGYFKDKYLALHKWATEQWNYQGGGLGPEEASAKDLMEASQNLPHQGLGFNTPHLHIRGPHTMNESTNLTNATLLNIQDELWKLKTFQKRKKINPTMIFSMMKPSWEILSSSNSPLT